MKKQLFFALFLLVSLPGCWGKRSTKHDNKPGTKVAFSEVNIPVAGEGATAFFDEDAGEFAYVNDGSHQSDTDFADLSQWNEMNVQENFKAVYFDFDKDGIRRDQEDTIAYDVARIKQTLKEHDARGTQMPMTVVIEGHSCHSAGTAAYNMSLSERRAKRLKERLIAEGVPAETIKIVGFGQEVPAIVNGRPVDGDRDAQWPNRRDEIRVIYS